jgi:hypothetical protein
MWKSVLFTAYTGSAASCIGGIIISKAAYTNQQKQLSADYINERKDVRILVIDEVSFINNSILRRLNNKLMNIGNRSKSFGGFSFIFAGDFHQLVPIHLQESDPMFSSLSSMFGRTI